MNCPSRTYSPPARIHLQQFFCNNNSNNNSNNNIVITIAIIRIIEIQNNSTHLSRLPWLSGAWPFWHLAVSDP